MNQHRRIVWMPIMAVSAAMLLAASAGGQEREGRRRGGQRSRDPQEMLKRMDKDGDGKLSKEEFTGPEQFFERMDADKDGFVTAKELAAMRQGRGGRGGRAGRIYFLDVVDLSLMKMMYGISTRLRRESGVRRFSYQVLARCHCWSRSRIGRRGRPFASHQRSTFSSDRKSSMVAQVKMTSSHQSAAGTA